jgi:hypothetical protein
MNEQPLADAQPAAEATFDPSRITQTPEELMELAASAPWNPMPLYLLANALRRQGDPRWSRVAASASARPHGAPQHVCVRGLARILSGDWGGWTDYQMRLRDPDALKALSMFNDLCWTHQEWDGSEDLSNKSLLILPEQGFGDCLQMWRFIPALIEGVATPILSMYPQLLPLAKHNFGSRAKTWLCHVKPATRFDRYVWSMSLPSIFGTLPTFTPIAPPGRRAALPSRKRPMRAGLCWAGSPDYIRDTDRSIPIAALEPLLSDAAVEWVSLQVGTRAADGRAYPSISAPEPPLVTFADTADVMSQLDFVVTIDTSVAHLAGLLGLTTYLLLQFDSHWRWGLETTTPWYPSVRLIRQHTLGDWDSAVADAAMILNGRDPA